MFDQMSGYCGQANLHIKLTITPALFIVLLAGLYKVLDMKMFYYL